VIPHDILDNLNLHLVISMDENVAEASHLGQALREAARDHIDAHKESEQSPIRLRFAQALVGGYVRGDIKGRLNRHLERVFHESLLADIFANPVHRRERSELVEQVAMRASFLATSSRSVIEGRLRGSA